MGRGLPRLTDREPRPEPLIIAGGGPSLAETLGLLREQVAAGGILLAVNEVPHYLVARGLRPWAAAYMGPNRFTVACIGVPHEGVRYFMASMCPPDAFERLRGHDVVLWHAAAGIGEEAVISPIDPDAVLIDGGQTVTMRALMLGYTLGFRSFHLHGVDSAMREDMIHAYPSVSDGATSMPLHVQCDGGWFKGPVELLAQAQNFPDVFNRMKRLGVELSVHGTGLIPMIFGHIDAGRPPPPLLVEAGLIEANAGPNARVGIEAERF